MSGALKVQWDENQLFYPYFSPIPPRFFLIQQATKPQREDWLEQANSRLNILYRASSLAGRKTRQDLSLQKAPCNFSISLCNIRGQKMPGSKVKSLSNPGIKSLRHSIILHCLDLGILHTPFFFMLLQSNSPAICFMNVMQTPSAPRTPLFTSSRTNHTN